MVDAPKVTIQHFKYTTRHVVVRVGLHHEHALQKFASVAMVFNDQSFSRFLSVEKCGLCRLKAPRALVKIILINIYYAKRKRNALPQAQNPEFLRFGLSNRPNHRSIHEKYRKMKIELRKSLEMQEKTRT